MIPPRSIAAFLTGRSVRRCNGLSAAQRQFQRASPIPAGRWLPWNFPYRDSTPFPEPFPLVRASLNNLAEFLISIPPGFRRQYRDHVVRTFSDYQTVILLAGSCGLELLSNLDLPAETLGRLHVFAYGPVSRRRPRVASLFLVQGESDLLSRCFHREVDARIPCGHMDYLDHPQTMKLFEGFCQSLPSPR